MENSAFEALMIGVNVFVFIIALSAAILLMSNVIDMVNFANAQAVVGMNGTIAEEIGIVNERIYKGSKMLTYYREQIERIELEKSESQYDFKVKLDKLGQEKDLKAYIETESIKNYLNKDFLLQYKGKIGDKYTYVFTLKQD